MTDPVLPVGLEALRLAKQAVNGWACYARTHLEHDDIARLHREIDALEAVLSAEPRQQDIVKPPQPQKPLYGCKQCRRAFSTNPVNWTEGGIPAVTNFFCSKECREDFLCGREATEPRQQGNRTECCGVPIDPDERFCRKCGWEARVTDAERLKAAEPRQQERHLEYLRTAMRQALGLSVDAPDEDIIDSANEQSGFVEHYEAQIRRIAKATGAPDNSSEQWASDIASFVESAEPRHPVAAVDLQQDALNRMFAAYQDLKRLGWNDAIYCPKDGSHFDMIEAGSTGVHDGNYEGEWPNGHWWAYGGDMWPSRPILFRVRAALAAAPPPTPGITFKGVPVPFDDDLIAAAPPSVIPPAQSQEQK